MRKENSAAVIDGLADEIRTAYGSDPEKAADLIRDIVAQRLEHYGLDERLHLLERLALKFSPGTSPLTARSLDLESEAFSKLFLLLLGRTISADDLSSRDLFDKLALSLNTIFDKLNHIIAVIHTTLLGEREELETIRQIIGSNIEGEVGAESLEDYLDQIEEAFLVAHKAFQLSSRIKIGQILSEIDPGRLAQAAEGGLKFGPLRKAELFEIYTGKFTMIKTWYDSGKLMSELLKEFERNCQKLYKKKTGGKE